MTGGWPNVVSSFGRLTGMLAPDLLVLPLARVSLVRRVRPEPAWPDAVHMPLGSPAFPLGEPSLAG